ncbi:MAG: DUF2029 domain-containing protein [Anaerolineales bacterium]|nr:DUF2029 domain-containing protein [Anaerolineales bacterium]
MGEPSSVLTRLTRWLSTRQAIITALILLALVYAAWISYQYRRNLLYDFNLYYAAALGFRQGWDIYGMMQDINANDLTRWSALGQAVGVPDIAPPYRYPPLTAQLVLPFTLLPYRMAGILWITLTAVAYVISAWLIGKSSGYAFGPGLALWLLLLWVPALTTMHAGQINGFVLLALAVSFYGLARGRPWIAGIGLAVATLLKLVPGILVLYLFWRRQWKAGIIAIATSGLLMLASLLTFPISTLSAYFSNFFAMGQPGSLFTAAPNQGISGIVARLFGGVFPDPAIYRLYVAAALIVILVTFLYLWPLRSPNNTWPYEFGVLLCVINLITPYAWYHQLIWLLIPLLLVTATALARRQMAVLIILAILIFLSGAHGLFWHSFENSRWLTSFPAILTLTMYGLQIYYSRTAGTSVQPLAPLASQPT